MAEDRSKAGYKAKHLAEPLPYPECSAPHKAGEKERKDRERENAKNASKNSKRKLAVIKEEEKKEREREFH